MQDNKTPKPDDLDLEDNLALDDGDSEVNFTDDSWDEFDEDPATSKGDASEEAAPRVKEKSFFAKNFNAIVIGVVLLGGAAFFLLRGGSDTATPTDAASLEGQSGMVELSDNANPPMPAPIDSATETTDLSLDIPQPEANIPSDTLTPMPEPEQLAEMPLPVDAPSPSTEEMQNLAAPAEAAPVEPVASDISEMPTPEPSFEAPAEMPPVAVAAMDSAVTDKISNLEQDLASLRSDLESKINDANQKADSTNQKLDALADSIESLQKKLDEAPQAAVASAVSTSITEEPPQQVESKPTPAPAKPAAKKKAKAAAPKKAKTSSATADNNVTGASSWDLRSAQPGRAIVSPKGSGEMKTVVVGDTLQGIGKILSINMENGTWVVRGTKGTVSR
jgi:hypothetical protein